MPRQRHTVTQSCFGSNGPSKNLKFPTSANITAVELLTFFPNSIKSTDVVYRFSSNGATRNVIWIIINTCRLLEKDFSQNSCGTAVYNAMRRAGFDGWTFNIHEKWHGPRRATWNESSIDVAGFRTPCEIGEGGELASDFPFADLAVGVWRFPVGSDALDLTRMVEYCVAHPEERWKYPSDYGRLLALIGGPHQVEMEHRDRMAFHRWKDVVPPPQPSMESRLLQGVHSPQPSMESRLLQGVHSPQILKERSMTRADFSVPQPQSVLVVSSMPLSPTSSRSSKSVHFDNEGLTLEGDCYEAIEVVEAQTNEVRLHSIAYWVAPPSYTRDSTLDLIGHDFGEDGCGAPNAFEPYAFFGPRETPPFRPLHLIGSPELDDLSNWAENLRWAVEQRITFGVAGEGWDERPEHMSRIAEVRAGQRWVSQEWLESRQQTHARTAQ